MSWFGVRKSVVRGALMMLVAFGLLTGIGVVQPGQASAQSSNGLYRAIKNANIRNKPSKNSVVLTTAPKYAIVTAVGPTKGCGAHSCAWVKIAYDGVEGWTKGAYFEPALVVDGTAVANVNLNLRATPGYDGQVLAVIPADGELKLTGRQSYPWVSVTYNGQKGWVYAEYLTVYPAPQY